MDVMSATTPVYALDFDGVICDSVAESSITAINGACVVWPGSAMGLAAGGNPYPDWLVRSVERVRPIIETGYENLILARYIAETGSAEAADRLVESLLEGKNNWTTLRDDLMEKWDVDRSTLVETFGKARDDWIERDVKSWLAANKFYPDVADALNSSTADIFIVSTKQARFVKLLLDTYNVHRIPESRIYGLESGTKIASLKRIVSLPESKGRKVLFVEDRYPTLEAVSLSMLGQPLRLFLASWGFNTDNDRKTAERHPFIEVLDLPSFTARFQ